MNAVPENAPTATIETDDDYRRAIARARQLAHAVADTAEGLELAALTSAIERYDDLKATKGDAGQD